MADEPNPNPDPEPEPATDPAPNPDPEPDDLGDAGKKAIKAERDARKALEAKVKELEPLATKAKELEDAQKSEVDKLNDRIAELEPSTKEAARLRVALRKGLTETQAKRLVGDTEEDLEADADELVAEFAPPEEDGTPAPARRPQERLRPGATPSGEPEKSPEELADAVLKRQRGY